MSIHHLKGPSSASRWLPCGGSLNFPFVGEAGPEALEGTRLHDVASRALRRVYQLDMAASLESPEPIDEAVQTYLEFVQDQIDLLNDPEIYAELYCPPTDIPDFGGTIDCLLIDDELGHVIDLKTGYRFVAAKDNEQLLCYALLARQKFPQLTDFRISIVQPRIGFSSTHAVTSFELDEFEKLVKNVDKHAYNPGTCCEFCPGRLSYECQALDNNLVEVMSYA